MVDKRLCKYCDYSDKSVKDKDGNMPVCLLKMMTGNKDACRFP